MRTTLGIDIESYSSVDLVSCGLYRYVEPDDFQILLFAYAFDEDPVVVVDLALGETLPEIVLDALTDPDIIKRAYNAQFERTCLSKHLKQTLDPAQWHCTQVLASAAGLPGHLAEVARVLKLDQQKMESGKSLIPYFCKPCTPTKINHQRSRNLPHHDPAKWALFKKYNAQDVETERAVYHAVDYTFTPIERAVYILDQRINDRGIAVDLQLVENILSYNETYMIRLNGEASELSGLENPNSPNQLKKWLKEQGSEVENLQKETVKDLIRDTDNDDVEAMLLLRQELAKTSVTKYDVLDRATCQDGRIRGVLQYYGANRTGRWAGRLVQVQNLPKTYLHELESLRSLIKRDDFDALEVTYPSLSNVFSQLIRTAFIAGEGNTFVVSDYSAIEARIIAWLAHEQWRLDVFASHGKIYEASASQMFKIPLDQIDKSLRSKGKVSELALGYNGGPGALIRMGALKMGLAEEELPGLVNAWRKANPAIKALWKNVETCALRVLEIPNHRVSLKNIHPGCPVDVIFAMNGSTMEIELPSGRKLSYINACVVGDVPYSRIQYEGMDQETKKWVKQESYGGKLVENLIQAIARDCLAEAMLRIDANKYRIVFHVHDEVIVEVPIGDEEDDLNILKNIMAEPLCWAPGLRLPAEAFLTKFYRKD